MVMPGAIGILRSAASCAAAMFAAVVFGVSVDKAVEFCFVGGLDVWVVFGSVLRGDLHDGGVEDVVVFGDKGAGGENVEAVAAEDTARRVNRRGPLGIKSITWKLSLWGRMRLRTMGVSKCVYDVGGVPQDFAGLVAGAVVGTERVP